MKKHLANLVTSCRILCSVEMLFCPVFSPALWGLYLVGGLPDMVDGTIARKTNSVTDFGFKLDSVADLVFVIAACCKLLPVIHLPGWIWWWALIIAIIKLINMVSGLAHSKKLLFEHTVLNKITGFLLFLLPPTPSFDGLKYSAFVVYTLVMISAMQEGYYIRANQKIV